jgi:hypothetical protein
MKLITSRPGILQPTQRTDTPILILSIAHITKRIPDPVMHVIMRTQPLSIIARFHLQVPDDHPGLGGSVYLVLPLQPLCKPVQIVIKKTRNQFDVIVFYHFQISILKFQILNPSTPSKHSAAP